MNNKVKRILHDGLNFLLKQSLNAESENLNLKFYLLLMALWLKSLKCSESAQKKYDH